MLKTYYAVYFLQTNYDSDEVGRRELVLIERFGSYDLASAWLYDQFVLLQQEKVIKAKTYELDAIIHIQNYGTKSQKLPPEQYVTIMNEYVSLIDKLNEVRQRICVRAYESYIIQQVFEFET